MFATTIDRGIFVVVKKTNYPITDSYIQDYVATKVFQTLKALTTSTQKTTPFFAVTAVI